MARDSYERTFSSFGSPSSREERKREAERREREEAEKDRQEIVQAKRLIARLGRDYPLQVCEQCHQVDGWLAGGEYSGLCLHCLLVHPFHKRIEQPLRYQHAVGSIYMSRRGRWSFLRQLERLSDRRPPRWTRLLKLLGVKRPFNRRALRSFRHFVSDRPESPPYGTQEIGVWGAEKYETTSPFGDERLLIFKCGWYYWQKGRFLRAPSAPYDYLPAQSGSVFSATLPVEQLVSAWHDFQQAVSEKNIRAFKTRERELLKAREREALESFEQSSLAERLRLQEGVADLF